MRMSSYDTLTCAAMLCATAYAAAAAEQPILREIAVAPDPAQLWVVFRTRPSRH
jgi:hypothetical protein